MSDSLSKAKRFRDRAEDCTKLAELATSDKVRQHYIRTAERFLAKARAELQYAEKIARDRQSHS
jgi:hypothetical protein